MSTASQLMDKQVTGLSSSQSADIFELLAHPRGDGKADDIFDFKPTRHAPAFTDLDGTSAGGARAWSSADSAKPNAPGIRNYGAVEPHDLTVASEKGKDVPRMDILSEIDRTMSKYTENLMHTLEGVSARLSQMETRTRHLENSVDDLKVTVGNNHGSTDGKLRHLENILREVQNGIQMVRDKQEITEAQLQLSKLQVSKTADQTVEAPITKVTDSLPQPIQPPAVAFPQQTLAPNAPPPVQQSPPQTGHLPNQLPTNQLPSGQILPRESYYTPPQSSEAAHPQYQMPAQQPQPYHGVPPHAQYSQPSQMTQQQPPALGSVNINPPPQQLQRPVNFHPEENPYVPPGPPSYPPSMRPSVGLPPSQSGSPSSPRFFGPNSNMYEPSGSRSGSGNFSYPSGYGSPASGSSGNDPNTFSGSSSHYGGPLAKHPVYSSPSAPIGGSGHSRIPTAQLLPQALPTATSVGSNSSGGTGNRVPVDDVVEKVTTMGFSRDQVRAMVRKLTENGQSVDLNVVLDKLMNDGEIQPQKGWFGR